MVLRRHLPKLILIFLVLFAPCIYMERRYHAVVTVDKNEHKLRAHTRYTQDVGSIGPLDDAEDHKTLSIEIDDLQPIKIVPVAKSFQQFAVTVGDQVIYQCRMLQHARSSSIATLMHLFLDNCRFKIAQSQDSVCVDRRKIPRRNGRSASSCKNSQLQWPFSHTQ